MNSKGLLFVLAVLSASLCSSPRVLASESGSFDSEQLSRIRQVSQSLLQVRGQRRQLTASHHAKELEKLEEVKGLLQKALTEARAREVVQERSIEIFPLYQLTGSNGGEAGTSGRLPGQYGKYNSSGDKNKGRNELESLSKALVAAREARDAAASKVVPKWRIWADQNEEAEVKLEMLEVLERKISELSGREEVTSGEVERLYREVVGTEQKAQNELEPTIYTIRKHVK